MIEMDGVFHDKIETGVDNNFEDENYQWNKYATKYMQQDSSNKI